MMDQGHAHGVAPRMDPERMRQVRILHQNQKRRDRDRAASYENLSLRKSSSGESQLEQASLVDPPDQDSAEKLSSSFDEQGSKEASVFDEEGPYRYEQQIKKDPSVFDEEGPYDYEPPEEEPSVFDEEGPYRLDYDYIPDETETEEDRLLGSKKTRAASPGELVRQLTVASQNETAELLRAIYYRIDNDVNDMSSLTEFCYAGGILATLTVATRQSSDFSVSFQAVRLLWTCIINDTANCLTAVHDLGGVDHVQAILLESSHDSRIPHNLCWACFGFLTDAGSFLEMIPLALELLDKRGESLPLVKRIHGFLLDLLNQDHETAKQTLQLNNGPEILKSALKRHMLDTTDILIKLQ
jgi:hypothetical protein